MCSVTRVKSKSRQLENEILNLQVKSVKLPREGGDTGRLKGFGYAEFEDRESLLQALNMNDEVRIACFWQ